MPQLAPVTQVVPYKKLLDLQVKQFIAEVPHVLQLTSQIIQDPVNSKYPLLQVSQLATLAQALQLASLHAARIVSN